MKGLLKKDLDIFEIFAQKKSNILNWNEVKN